MATKLFLDYCRRWYVLPIVIGYAGMSLVQAWETRTEMLTLLSTITFYVFIVYFLIEYWYHKNWRIILSLPVSRRDCSQTLWLTGVFLPPMLLAAVFIMGHIGINLIKTEPIDLWADQPYRLCTFAALGGGLFLFLGHLRWNGRNWMRLIVFSVLFILYCILLFTLSWSHATVAKAFQIALGIIIPSAAYFESDNVFDALLRKESATYIAGPVSNTYDPGSKTLAWWDRLRANPAIGIPLTANLLLLMIAACAFWEDKVFHSMGELVSLLLVFAAVGLFLLLLMEMVKHFCELRVYVTLPISKRKLAFCYLLIPAVALFPIALLAYLSPLITWKWYLVFYAILLINNLMLMNWGPKSAIITLTTLGVVLQAFLIMIMTKSAYIDWMSQWYLDSIAISAFIAVGMVWTWKSIVYSSLPYRKKPEFTFGC